MNRFLLSLTLITLLFAMVTNTQSAANDEPQIKWRRAADLNLPRGGYFAAWHDGGLWIAGGSYWKDGEKLWTNEASFYDPEKGCWTSAKPLPKSFGYGVTAGIGKDLFILGGVDGTGSLNKDVYRLRSDKWEKIGESPSGFIYAAYAAISKKIYVFGGSVSPSDVTKAMDTVWIYDTGSNKWKQSKPFPGAPRQIFSAAAIGDQIYFFGGITQKPGEKYHNLDDAFRFDTKTESWKRLANMPVAMRAHWTVSGGGSIYLIGGYADGGLDSVYRYSPSEDSYELVSRLPQPLMDTKFLFNDGKFYGAGGEDDLMSRFGGLVIGTIKK
ncbi:MAG: kelch repeat-containing protein [Pyrinomonadaceae bacterium]